MNSFPPYATLCCALDPFMFREPIMYVCCVRRRCEGGRTKVQAAAPLVQHPAAAGVSLRFFFPLSLLGRRLLACCLLLLLLLLLLCCLVLLFACRFL